MIRDRIFDWTSARLPESPEEQRRGRLLTAFVVVLMALSVPAVALYYLQQGELTTSVIAACAGPAALFLVFPLLWRTGSVTLAGTLVLICIAGGLTLATTVTGGLQSEILLWILVVPLLAHVFVSAKSGVVWTAITIAIITTHYYLHKSGHSLPDPMPVETIRWWRAVHMSTAAFFLGFLGWFYERERLRITRAGEADKARLTAVVEDAPVVLFCFDSKGIIWLAEGQGQGALANNAETWLQRSVFDVLAVAPEAKAKLNRAMKGENINFVVEIDDSTFQIHCTPQLDSNDEVTGVTGVSLDTTDLTRMERQLAISDRMASLGALAAGIGHEINNPLTYVLGSVEFAQSALKEQDAPDPEVLEALTEALDGATRVQDIVADLRMFSPRKTDKSVPIKLEPTIRSAINLTRSALLRSQVSIECPTTLPEALGDAPRLGQVLVNLLVNASHALPKDSAQNNSIRVACFADGDDAVVIEVHDSGRGIQASNLDKIFDPFFTTKATGTGLGLAICHEIISSMSGTLTVSSEVGTGSCFRIRLPRALPLQDEAQE